MNIQIPYKEMYYGENMREVIDYVQDIRTGRKVTQKKIKPVGAGTNTCIVEMYEGKEKVKEAVTHNIVNNYVNQIAFLNYFYDNCKKSSNFSSLNPFTNVLLTDYDGDEDANDVCVRGNVIGWANKSTEYVGTDILKGTINNAESSVSDSTQVGYLKYVFDFPTHAANGDINSIWWAYGSSNSYRMLGDSYLRKWSSRAYNDICCDGAHIYGVNNSGTIFKMVMDSYSSEGINFALPNYLRGIEWDGTNFWLMDNSSKNIYKCNANFSVVSTMSTSISENIIGLTLYNNKIFVSTSDALYRIALDGTMEARITAETLGFQAGGIIGAKANNKYLMCVGKNGSNYYVGFLDINGNVMYLKDRTDENYGFSTFCFVNSAYYANSNFYIRHRNNDREFAYIGGVGAHTKLPTTITKTNTNTMKVTYIFSIEMPVGGGGS